jgi:hypothetical protein
MRRRVIDRHWGTIRIVRVEIAAARIQLDTEICCGPPRILVPFRDRGIHFLVGVQTVFRLSAPSHQQEDYAGKEKESEIGMAT